MVLGVLRRAVTVVTETDVSYPVDLLRLALSCLCGVDFCLANSHFGSTLIEIMPMGYTDYAFNLLADSCKVWYDELQSMKSPSTFVSPFFSLYCSSLLDHWPCACP